MINFKQYHWLERRKQTLNMNGRKKNWKNKVTDYIKNILLSNELENIAIGKLNTVNAGNIDHLKTIITATMPKDKSILEIAKSLHPTPAVGGFPKAEGVGIINNCEKYNRSYYTGFLGLIGPYNADLFVNIRCAQFFEKAAYLYLGAGITAASIPEKEWIETENKSKGLISAIDYSQSMLNSTRRF